MISSTINNNLPQDQQIWNSLQKAIAKTSGFQRWQMENKLEDSIEEQVKQYLRSTLETLAY